MIANYKLETKTKIKSYSSKSTLSHYPLIETYVS